MIFLFRKKFAKRQNSGWPVVGGRFKERDYVTSQQNQYPLLPNAKVDGPFFTHVGSVSHGVMVTDVKGNVVYYNQVYSIIDKLPVDYVLGKNVRFLYGPDPGPSLVISCIESRKPILNYVCVDRTVKGEIINSAHWLYPFFKGDGLLGCMAFVQALDALTEPSPAPWINRGFLNRPTGVSRQNLSYKLKKYGLNLKDFRQMSGGSAGGG